MQKSARIKIIVVLLVVAIAGVGYMQYKKAKETKEQEAVVEALDFSTESVKAITANWNPTELQNRAHPSLLKNVAKSGVSMTDYFNTLRKLGKLKPGAKCNLSNLMDGTDPDNGNAHFTYADFVCDTLFDNSEAKMLIEIRQDAPGTPWKINTFRVDSPLFAAPKKDADKKPAESPKQ